VNATEKIKEKNGHSRNSPESEHSKRTLAELLGLAEVLVGKSVVLKAFDPEKTEGVSILKLVGVQVDDQQVPAGDRIVSGRTVVDAVKADGALKVTVESKSSCDRKLVLAVARELCTFDEKISMDIERSLLELRRRKRALEAESPPTLPKIAENDGTESESEETDGRNHDELTKTDESHSWRKNGAEALPLARLSLCSEGGVTRSGDHPM
jgi:hypothetical protein